MIGSKVTRPESLSARVRRGVALLDEMVPGWHQKIDVDTLDINSPTDCILGQLFCCFFCGRNEVGLQKYADEVHGLNTADDEVAAVTRLWAYVVRRRQQAVFYVHRDESGVDLAYRIDFDGTVSVWSELYGWHESKFRNLNGCSEYDRQHFADHLVPVSVEQLPAGAR